MTKLQFAVIGNASLALEGAKLLLARGHQVVSFTAQDPALIAAAKAEGLVVSDIAECDYLLSLAHLNILDAASLAKARRGAVNFHDAPLPERGGLNAPVWALLQGETEHAITWHRITGGVDAGPVLLRVPVAIMPNDSALALNARCWEAARESLPQLIQMLEQGQDQGTAQAGAVQNMHRRADRPQGAAMITPSVTAADNTRMVHALDHGPYWNPLLSPRLATQGGLILVQTAEVVAGQGPAGQILATTDDSVTLACADNTALTVGGFTSLDGQAVPHGLAVGDMIPDATPDSEGDQVIRNAAKDEPFWRKRLAQLTPLSVPGSVSSDRSPDWQQRRIVTATPVAPQMIAAALCAAIARMTAADAFDIAEARVLPAALHGHLQNWVPLAVSAHDTTFGTLADQLAAEREMVQAKGAILGDLVARAPELSRAFPPGLMIADSPDHLPAGVVLCIALSDGTASQATIWYDRNRLPEAACDAIVAITEALSATTPDTPLDIAPTLHAGAAATVAGNDVTLPDDAPATIAQGFLTQAALTPQAPALVFRDQTLTYAETRERAQNLARQLAAMGVGPGQPVGLCAPRGTGLVIGALAILLAGGAYVPLDPAYPADRISHYISDSGASVIVADRDLVATLPTHNAQVLTLDADQAQTEPTPAAGSDLAYLIYTSGSTGQPKGVMVEHRNVINFFAGMDAVIPAPKDGVGTWMAVTSLSFDISVLEIFWTLTRGWKVVISDEMLSSGSAPAQGGTRKGMPFSLFYWGNDDGAGSRKYELLLDGARFADDHGFIAVWTPERHFHAFGGPYPNPAVTGAAVAAVTKNIGVRAGSCVAPLHHTARIAEEWAVIDNLTDGRAGLAIASGWQPDDFVLRPENTPPNNKAAMAQSIDQLRKLWRGEKVGFPRADGTLHEVLTQPRPVSAELPVWVTTAGNPETWREAGRLGANILTHLLGQSMDDIAARIPDYHAALREAGHDPADFTVTLMLHSYLAETREEAMEVAREPMKDYLRSAAALVKQYAWAFPAFKKPVGVDNAMSIDLSSLSPEEMDGILDFAFLRYFNDSGLFGTVDDAEARIKALKAIGVGEIACLIDYGISTPQVMQGLTHLAKLHDRVNPVVAEAQDTAIAAQITRHDVTHMQCTPSMMRLLLEDAPSRAALSGLQTIALGGEALAPGLLSDLRSASKARVLNMYGPTETTIWSAVSDLGHNGTDVQLGQPIANTTLHLRDAAGAAVADGVAAELWIGGDGVTRGYWQRAEQTAGSFRDDPAGRLYRTGDLVRRDPDGVLRFLGRVDQQVKIRGYRIELGEIETRLAEQPDVHEVAVVAQRDDEGQVRLIGFVTAEVPLDLQSLRTALAKDLPEFMVPARLYQLNGMPLTPNRKTDRKALATLQPAPVVVEKPVAPVVQAESAPAETADAGELAGRIGAIMAQVLGLPNVAPQDNFFNLGGHSLLAVQLHRRLKEEAGLTRSSITDIFRFPVLQDLVAHLTKSKAPVAPIPTPQAVATPTEAQTTAGSSATDLMSARRALRARMRNGGR